MRCVREMGMRVLIVHLKIYINCTIDGRLSSELYYSRLLSPQYFVLLFPVSHTALPLFCKRKVSGSTAGVAYVLSWVLFMLA